MRWLLAVFVGITAFLWWMLIDSWPALPERLPLLHWRADREAWFVARSALWWFGPPAVVTCLAWGLGAGGARWLTLRARAGTWLPLPHWDLVRQLAVAERVWVMQPVRLAVLFVAACAVIQVGAWYADAAELAQGQPARAGYLPMLAVMMTGLGSGVAIARLRVRRLGQTLLVPGRPEPRE